MQLRARHHAWVFPRPALIMGVVNVTPDSFSDGGSFAQTADAVRQALALESQGADLIDIGGESTRPGASPVPEEEELRRVLPVLERLNGRLRVPVSIDTVKPQVARQAVRLGAAIINDVAANRTDAEMWNLVAETGAGYVVVHMLGTPETMQTRPAYGNVVAEINDFFEDRLSRLQACGVNLGQVMLDPGIGFGKRLEDNLRLIGDLRGFAKWNRPLLLGASRKSFMEPWSVETDRLPASLACACWGAAHGAGIIRCHNVAETRAAVRMTEALMAKQTDV